MDDLAEMIQRGRFNLRSMAGRSGISLAYVKHLSARNRQPSPEHKRRIAKAFREHACQLLADADALENGGS